jgi:hypothetical protein
MLNVLLQAASKNLLEKVISPIQAVAAGVVVGAAIIFTAITSNRQAAKKQKLADLRDQRIAKMAETVKSKEKPVQQKSHHSKSPVPVASNGGAAVASHFSGTTGRVLPALAETHLRKPRKNKLDKINAEYERLQTHNRIQQNRRRIRNSNGVETAPAPELTRSRYNRR